MVSSWPANCLLERKKIHTRFTIKEQETHHKERKYVCDGSKSHCTHAGITVDFTCRLMTSARQFSKAGVKGLPEKGDAI